jgi:hypothetical protein
MRVLIRYGNDVIAVKGSKVKVVEYPEVQAAIHKKVEATVNDKSVYLNKNRWVITCLETGLKLFESGLPYDRKELIDLFNKTLKERKHVLHKPLPELISEAIISRGSVDNRQIIADFTKGKGTHRTLTRSDES